MGNPPADPAGGLLLLGRRWRQRGRRQVTLRFAGQVQDMFQHEGARPQGISLRDGIGDQPVVVQ